MKNQSAYPASPRLIPHLGELGNLVFVALLLSLGMSARAQDEKKEEAPPSAVPATRIVAPDATLTQISGFVQGVTTPELGALSEALRINERVEGAVKGFPPNTLTSLGDLDGDGVPEMVLKWAIPDVDVAADLAPAPDSRPLWGFYLLAWDGTRWKVSSLASDIEDAVVLKINLGKSLGQCIALVTLEGDPQVAYPMLFQVKEHAAKLLWDAQADDSRYIPFMQGRVDFQDRGEGPAEMIVTGHVDAGLLQFDKDGHRGFKARAVYHWDGAAYVPAKTEYTANEDYTLYRFIAALHLHDYRSAYALIAPAKFLNSDSPTLDAFHQFIQDNWPEFLGDTVFQTAEPPAGAAEGYVFVLLQPDKLYRYQPTFSSDGKFLLTGLKRTVEALPAEPPTP